MTQTTVMQAPKGTTGTANIHGHQYEIPENGKIKVVNQDHVETLKRHGFIESTDDLSEEELDALIEGFDDKDKIVEFIEERGGEADSDMGWKKLRRLAREAATGETEE
jgi:hypothetical protein